MNVVYVKEFDEIVKSLDQNDSLNGVQFMPEMIKYCGTKQELLAPVKRVKSDKRRFIDKLGYLEDVYLLENTWCDGEHHNNCSRKCRILWHEEWFTEEEPQSMENTNETDLMLNNHDPLLCQSTTIDKAMTHISSSFFKNIFEWFYIQNTSLKDIVLDVLDSLYYIYFSLTHEKVGILIRTPTNDIGLKVGDKVRVKSFDEIKATLDTKGRNRGLGFQTEMIKFCGKGVFTVSDVMNNAISEYTDEIKKVKSSVLLKETFCDGRFHRRCGRKCPHIWREIWLKKV